MFDILEAFHFLWPGRVVGKGTTLQDRCLKRPPQLPALTMRATDNWLILECDWSVT